MRTTTWLAIAACGVTVLAISQCDRTPAARNKAIVLNPATRATEQPRQTALQPATTGPATQPAKKSSYMMVNGAWVEFPEAKLTLKKHDDQVTAFLVSKDPPEVLSPRYHGNRYYFELKLDTIDDPKNIAVAEFRYKAASAEPADSPNGIFLDGDRMHLQPYDIQVAFDRDGEQLIAEIRGQFLHFPKGQIVGEMIPVAATVVARPESK